MVACCSASLAFLRFPLLFGGKRGSVEEEDEDQPELAPRAASSEPGRYKQKNATRSLRTPVFLPSELAGHIYLVTQYFGTRRTVLRVGHMAKNKNTVPCFSGFVVPCDTIVLA